MFFPNYTNNETFTGPLSAKNELTIDVHEFPRYAHYVKSSQSNAGRKYSSRSWANKETTVTAASSSASSSSSSMSTATSDTVAKLPPYTMQEFFVTNTRMVYADGVRALGFAAPPYTSSAALQNIFRLVIGPDIGYYLNTNDSQQQQPANQPVAASLQHRPKRQRDALVESDDEQQDDDRDHVDLDDQDVPDDNQDDQEERDNDDDDDDNASNGLVHSDFTRKYSPQEAHARVLAMPLFNGNTTTNILQSNKSECYYQLTMLLESSSRIYVLPAATIPSYTIVQPLAHLCRLLQMNPVNPPARYVVPIERIPQWRHLKEACDVKYAVLLPPNVSLMNRRDPVIKEGSLETVSIVFAYDNKDADVQYNNPYGCYNKHEDYDGDTNTQSLGKGVESHVEIYYNMKRQCLPCLRVKSVMPQNVLSRIMFYFVRDVEPNFDADHPRIVAALRSVVHEQKIVNVFAQNYVQYSRMIRTRFDAHHERRRMPIDRVRRVFAIELLRRACVCLAHLTTVDNQKLLPLAERVFGDRLPALLYLYYLNQRWQKIRPRVETFLHDYANDRATYARVDDQRMYNAVRDVLHEIHGLWKPVSRSVVSNCQTVVDDVTRAVYSITDEQTCTRMLDHCSRTVHEDYPTFFLSGQPYDLEYLVTVMSRAKGDFDSLLTMNVGLYERFRDEACSRNIERSRSRPLPLGSRDLLSRIEPERVQKYIDYTDKYVTGSKAVPKSCVQANDMKCAMQNVQYYDGDLWMNGKLILKDVALYLPNFFIDKCALDIVLDDIVARSLDVAERTRSVGNASTSSHIDPSRRE